MRRLLLQCTRWLVRRWDVALLVIFLVASFTVQASTLRHAAAPMTDEGVHVEAGRMLLEGYAPYRDFSYLHPPALPAFAAAGLKVFGGMHGTRLLYLLINTLSVAGFFAVIRKLTGDRGAALLSAVFLLTYHEMLFHDWRFLATRQFSNAFLAAFLYLGVVRPLARGSAVMQGAAAVLASLTIFPAFLNVLLSSAAIVAMEGDRFRAAKRYAAIVLACAVAIVSLFLIPGAYERLVLMHAEVHGGSRLDRLAWLFVSSGPNLPFYFFGSCGLVLGAFARPKLLPMCAAGIGMLALLLLPGEFLPHYVVLAAFPLALGVACFSLAIGSFLPIHLRQWSAVFLLPVLSLHLTVSLPSLLREWHEDNSGFWRDVELVRTLPEPVLTFQEPMYAIEAGKRATQHYARAGRQSFSSYPADELRALAERSCSIIVTGWDRSYLPDEVEAEWDAQYEQIGVADWRGVYLTHNSGC